MVKIITSKQSRFGQKIQFGSTILEFDSQGQCEMDQNPLSDEDIVDFQLEVIEDVEKTLPPSNSGKVAKLPTSGSNEDEIERQCAAAELVKQQEEDKAADLLEEKRAAELAQQVVAAQTSADKKDPSKGQLPAFNKDVHDVLVQMSYEDLVQFATAKNFTKAQLKKLTDVPLLAAFLQDKVTFE